MENILIILRNWLIAKRLSILNAFVWAVIIYCLIRQHVYMAFILMFIISLSGIAPIKEKLIKIIRSTFLIKFYNIVIWFLSYILSLKLLSYSTGIDEEKLKFSPAILAIPVSVIVIYFLILIFSFLMILLMQLVTPFSVFMTTKFKNKILKSDSFNFASRFNYLIILLAPFLLAAVYLAPPFMRLALLADSSFVSDCGPRDKSKSYIRIDEESCLRFDLNFSTLSNDPVIIPSKTKKPAKQE